MRGRRLVYYSNGMRLKANIRRRGRGKQDIGFAGQATWLSSVINLVNTSTNPKLKLEPIAK